MSKLSLRVAALEAVTLSADGQCIDINALSEKQVERLHAISLRIEEGETIPSLPTDDLRFVCSLPLRRAA